MGDKNQQDFVLENRKRVQGPILEIGSRDHGQAHNYTADFRKEFPDVPYIGTDLQAGKGVDVVCDFTQAKEVQERLGVGIFKTVICLSVLEHCQQPFHMAENMTQVLAYGGYLFLSVPFIWRLHAHPEDYWRFTPAAIKVLFPKLHVMGGYWSTKLHGERFHLSSKLPIAPVMLNMSLMKVRP